MKKTILELKVKNHPGVMSHVCGLFTCCAYNLEGILCLPMDDELHSRIWLLVNEDERLTQVIKQTEKLHDVIDIKHHSGVDHQVFIDLQKVFYTD